MPKPKKKAKSRYVVYVIRQRALAHISDPYIKDKLSGTFTRLRSEWEIHEHCTLINHFIEDENGVIKTFTVSASEIKILNNY